MWRCYLHLRWMFFPFLSPLAIFMVHLIFWHNWCFFFLFTEDMQSTKKKCIHAACLKNVTEFFISKIKKIGITISPILLKILDTFYVGDIQRNILVLETFLGSSLTLYRCLYMFTFLLPLVWLVWYLEPHWPSSYPSPSLLKHSASSVLQHYACRYSQ